MRTTSKVLAIALLAIFLASIEVKAILEVAHGHGSDVSFVNVYGFAVTWIEGAPLVESGHRSGRKGSPKT